MKKRFAVLLALSLTLGVLAGCGDKTNPPLPARPRQRSTKAKFPWWTAMWMCSAMSA